MVLENFQYQGTLRSVFMPYMMSVVYMCQRQK